MTIVVVRKGVLGIVSKKDHGWENVYQKVMACGRQGHLEAST